MFTGIIEAAGTVKRAEPKQGDVRLHIDTGALDMSDVALGDSIATNGICLTVVEFGASYFVADVSKETLGATTLGSWKAGHVVNLEKAMQPTSRFGGHIVSGHVDSVAKVLERYEDARSTRFEIEVPAELERYVATKGSVTLDGVSLTTNLVTGRVVSLNIVPHTLQVTSIGKNWQVGSLINMEVDVLARYLEQLLTVGAAPHADQNQPQNQNQNQNQPQSTASRIDEHFLKEHGFIKD